MDKFLESKLDEVLTLRLASLKMRNKLVILGDIVEMVVVLHFRLVVEPTQGILHSLVTATTVHIGICNRFSLITATGAYQSILEVIPSFIHGIVWLAPLLSPEQISFSSGRHTKYALGKCN